MTPNPKLSTPLFAQIARQMAIVNNPTMRYMNSPAFAYLQSPAFRAMLEHIRIAQQFAKPHMLAMQALETQRHQSKVMMLQISSWRRQPPVPSHKLDAAEVDDADVVWSAYPPDPNFGFRQNRFEVSE